MTSKSSTRQPTQPPNGGETPGEWRRANGGGSGYDALKFYCRSTDVRGHGDHHSVKMPPEIAREIRIFVEAGGFPQYQTAQDFIRDAIVHHLHTRSSQIGDPRIRERNERFFVMRDMEERLDEASRESEFWENQRAGWDKTFARLAKDEAWPQLGRHVRRALDVVNRAEEPYRTRMMKFLVDWWSRVPEEFRPAPQTTQNDA